MIEFMKGDMLKESRAHVLVNPVNTYGVMGKGLALYFRQQRPWHYPIYKKMCNKMDPRNLQIGFPRLLTPDSLLEQSIICFPTKIDWKYPSNLNWIESGLRHIVEMRPVWFDKNRHVTMAFPILGAGLGGLDSTQVINLMKMILPDMENTDVEIWRL